LIVVLGASGQVGTALTRLLPDAVSVSRRDFDLAVDDRVPTGVQQLRPDLVVNCAAYNAVDQAEDDEATVFRVNGTAAGTIARWCAEIGARLVTYSSDFVFDGAASTPYLESHPPHPLNAYGRSKLAGEQLVAEAGGSHLIIRTSWVVSATHPNFITSVLRQAQSGGLRVVDDQTGSPTVAADLAAATAAAIAGGGEGFLHLSNQGEATWFELARRAVELAGLDASLVAPCSSEEYPTRAPRPRYSVLGSERLASLGLDPLPPWEQSLPAVVEGQLDLLGRSAG
jgi:dTDP-4-dehydrorhamnose reductase